MSTLSNKIDFSLVFRVNHANPNGDPLNGNRPRVTVDGFGEVSDVCLKRKLRDRLCESGVSIFVQSDDRRIDSAVSLRDRFDAAKIGGTPAEIANKACKEWFDVRAFGQLFAFKGKAKAKKGADASAEEGDSGVSIPVRGPVTIQSAFSVEPVEVSSTQITKSVSGEGDGTKRSSDTMGMKHRIDRGIYVFHGSMSPQLASRTGFSDDDANIIKKVLPRLFENDGSSARPDGSMEVLEVVWWQHSNAGGICSSAKVHRALKVLDDGTVSVDLVPGITPERIRGF
jgi:CRISPR-associated protein Csd2